jgi:hypothetical protein
VSNYFQKYVYTPDSTAATPGPYYAHLSLIDGAAQHTGATVNVNPLATPLTYVRSKRRQGLRPRYLNLRLDTGATPNILTRHKSFLVLLPADFDFYLANPVATVTIGGVAWTIEDFVRESYVT